MALAELSRLKPIFKNQLLYPPPAKAGGNSKVRGNS